MATFMYKEWISFDDYKDYPYTPKHEDVVNALARIMIGEYLGEFAVQMLSQHGEYNRAVQGIEDFIRDYDLFDDLVDNFNDELTEWFEDEAYYNLEMLKVKECW